MGTRMRRRRRDAGGVGSPAGISADDGDGRKGISTAGVIFVSRE
jgi:hypothetical protein